MEKKIALAIMFIFLLSPILAMTDDGGNVPVVSKKETSKDTKQELRFSNTQVLNDINNAAFPEKHVRDSILVNKPIDKRMASILNRAGRFQTSAEDYLTVANVILEYEFSSVSSIKETLLASTGLIEKIKKSSKIKYDRFLRNLDRLSGSKNPTIKITSAGILKNYTGSNEKIVKIFTYFSQGTGKETWDLDGTSLFGYGDYYKDYLNEGFSIEEIKECAINEIRIDAFKTLINIDPKKALEISDYILNKEIIKIHIDKKLDYDYYDLRASIIRILASKQKKDKGSYNLKVDSKYLNTSTSNTWSPDSSAAYSLKYHGTIGTNSNEGYNPIYHDHTATSQDCANFGTQCLKHGGIDFSKASSSYICTANANTDGNICSCDNMNGYLESRDDFITESVYFPAGTSDATIDASVPNWFRNGDIAIWGIYGGDLYKHTIIRSSIISTKSKFSAHTTNRRNEDLHFFNTWDNVTFYHVVGSTVLENPAQEELTLVDGDSLDLKALVTNNTEPTSLNPITNFKFYLKKKPENTVTVLYETTDPPPSADSTYVYGFKVKDIPKGDYVLCATTTYSEGITQDSCSVTVKVAPKFVYPTPRTIYYVRPTNKGAVTDTLAIKVEVPEILGSYPAINIKIDGTYVNQGDITFDSEENVWVYNWDLSTESPTENGKMYNITTEIEGDPTDYATVGIFLVEAIFNEDFETITNLTAAGWHVYTWHTPFAVVNPGWIVGNKVLENNNGVALSVTIPSATYIGYRMWTPVINLPAVASGTLIKLKYRFYFNKSNSSSLYSLLKFCVTNSSEVVISAWSTLPGVDESWVDMEYDLTAYAGQSIKLQWFNNYLTGPALPSTEYCVDDIIVYQTIDTSAPAIDFIAGNSADIDADMNLNIGFNDNSGISNVTADYSIESDNNSITLYPVKGSFNYTGTIPARDHICEGSITFKIKDSVGNETVSAGHSISWGTGSILTAPENVVITQPTSTKISITWNIVDGATSYKVFSSTDPYGTFTEDTTGTFTESRKWEKTIDGTKYFYYVVAVNALKKEDDEIAKAIEVNVSDR
jgi:hypothetical protein